ncbi:LysR substrate-binding domain-containing protein [Halomonas sp. McH1-25]|uniref:LysR family transcriptional regulator n=1 Tax=unclassified Halomonas TaxID=2609666 RepID=UPI001EF646B6|nr:MULTISPECIES: LysR substrate-binding domain-containing protein [unclassified Halomonas]MCG7600964.1 LysR substrate-binding domain-containing protein [Halomonas sp. McH1-25]MCP1342056.1 LysR substrate-binding domain-containing protein [Halomonas sp. FL8]MCP1359762.1 LysR substrate-binding domain-containing protein [Halomonas sp. BBD45]MCP1364926.1 LysR substrate-binding domain-containing protein [Halomonas sp. BBD48]
MKLSFDLRALRYFVAVAEHGGFTRAAQSLHVAQSAVSQTIASLESRLELRLFHRHERRISLTPEGEVLLSHARELLGQAESIELAMREVHGLVKGEVRIGIPSMLGSYYFPPLLMGFKSRHPGIRLTVVEAGTRRLQRMIADGDLDLGVVTEDASTQGLERRHFLREEMVVCVPRDHRFAERESVTPQEVLGEPLVLFQDGYFHREFVDRLAIDTGQQPQVAFQSNLIPLTKAIVRQGFGITTFLRRVVEEPDLAAVSFEPAAWLDLSLAWNHGAYLSRAEQTFVDFVLEHLASR